MPVTRGNPEGMGWLRRYFGPVLDEGPTSSSDGRAPDALPEDVFLPKQRQSSRSLLAGKPPFGWQRHASDASGGPWPWSGGSDGDGGSGGGASGGGE